MGGKIAVMFPGSGSQYKGMMKKLYDSEKTVKDVFDNADDILGMNLRKTITEGKTVELNRIENALLGVFVSDVAMYRLFEKETGYSADYYMGHSLGEYAALVATGILSFDDALRAVDLRSRIAIEVQKNTDGGMTICKRIDPKKVKSICQKYSEENKFSVSIGCYNAPDQVTIVGYNKELQVVEKEIASVCANANIIHLIVSAPYHSVLMKERAAELESFLNKCTFASVEKSVISNVTARPYTSINEIKNGLTKQIYQPVLWDQSLSFVASQGVESFVEIGPLNVLKNLFIDSEINGKAYAYDELLDREQVKEMLKKENSISDNAYRIIIEECIKHARSLRNYRKAPLEGMETLKENYQLIVSFLRSAEKGEVIPDKQQAAKALDMLTAFFKAKETPMNEREKRMIQIGEISKEQAFCNSWIESEQAID